MKLLVFTGAGASVELGVPAMPRMAKEFHLHVKEWSIEPDLVSRMMSDDQDIEDLIEKLDNVCGAGESLKALGLDEECLKSAKSVQAEVEWYVQHSCERITPESAFTLWSSFLAERKCHNIVVATTNYDRSIELAANRQCIGVHDGFADFDKTEIAKWTGFGVRSVFAEDDDITLLKLHGSTDWYDLGGTGNPVKLRHPMPLFGGGSLRLPSLENELTAALVLPSREKRVSHHPFQRLSQAFLNATDEAELTVFVGSSFRDPHIRKAVEDLAKMKPTVVVGPSVSRLDLPASVIAISETGSHFLISTLPCALAADDPVAYLQRAAMVERRDEPIPVLSLVETALDKLGLQDQRRDAIEVLARGRIPLRQFHVEKLIEDGDSVVARFALGLVPDSPDSTQLKEAADAILRSRDDQDFADELDLLRNL